MYDVWYMDPSSGVGVPKPFSPSSRKSKPGQSLFQRVRSWRPSIGIAWLSGCGFSNYG